MQNFACYPRFCPATDESEARRRFVSGVPATLFSRVGMLRTVRAWQAVSMYGAREKGAAWRMLKAVAVLQVCLLLYGWFSRVFIEERVLYGGLFCCAGFYAFSCCGRHRVQ